MERETRESSPNALFFVNFDEPGTGCPSGPRYGLPHAVSWSHLHGPPESSFDGQTRLPRLASWSFILKMLAWYSGLETSVELS